MLRKKVVRSWYVVVYINHSDKASVLWSTKTEVLRVAKATAEELGNLIPEHGFEAKESTEATKVFEKDALPLLDEIRLVAMARLVC